MWENLLLHVSVSGLSSAERLRHLHRLALGFDQFSLAILGFTLLLHQLVGLQCPVFVISFLCLCPAGCFVGSINQLHVLMLASLSLQPPPSSPPAGASAIRLREHLRGPSGLWRTLQEIDFLDVKLLRPAVSQCCSLQIKRHITVCDSGWLLCA